MIKQSIFLVSNLLEEEALQEDLLLSSKLEKDFSIQLLDFRDLLSFDGPFLVRNAWPSRLWNQQHIQHITKHSSYNSIHRTFIEDKSYLRQLYLDGYPVIPTFNKDDNVTISSSKWFLKPLNGCSSYGIIETHEPKVLDGYITQPFLEILYESSLFFVDDVFQYALRSNGDRWNLSEYEPEKIELQMACSFVKWNKLPFGIQRIDLARLKDKFLLMEVEDGMPMLSLSLLSTSTIEKLIDVLSKSIAANLSTK